MLKLQIILKKNVIASIFNENVPKVPNVIKRNHTKHVHYYVFYLMGASWCFVKIGVFHSNIFKHYEQTILHLVPK